MVNKIRMEESGLGKDRSQEKNKGTGSEEVKTEQEKFLVRGDFMFRDFKIRLLFSNDKSPVPVQELERNEINLNINLDTPLFEKVGEICLFYSFKLSGKDSFQGNFSC